MSRPRTVVAWALAALLGLVFAAAVSIAASKLSSQRIGLAGEPITAGDELTPARTRTATTPKPQRPRRRKHPKTPTTTATTPTVPAVTTPVTTPPVTTTPTVTRTTTTPRDDSRDRTRRPAHGDD